MFRRVLIANRGGDARWIIATCHRLGVETVAVHSTADALVGRVRMVRLNPARMAQAADWFRDRATLWDGRLDRLGQLMDKETPR